MGGIQGLWWYARAMFADADGDVANQFMDERDVGHPRVEDGDMDDVAEGDARNEETTTSETTVPETVPDTVPETAAEAVSGISSWSHQIAMEWRTNR